MSEKNERIRSRLKAQAMGDPDTTKMQDADNTSRLSYSAFTSQDFLSSTRRSMVPDAKPKKGKKVKKKMQEAILFSSDEEELNTQHNKKPTKKQVKTLTKEPKMRATRRDPLTPRHDGNLHGPDSATKGLKKKLKAPSAKRNAKLGPSGQTTVKKNSEESNYPDTSSSHGHQSSSLSSSMASHISVQQATTSSKKTKSSVKKKPTPKKIPTFLNAVQFSSDSDGDNASVPKSTVVDLAKLRMKLKEVSISKRSANTNSVNDAGTHGQKQSKGGESLEYSLKQFVMDSDSEKSDDSPDEAFVTTHSPHDDYKQIKSRKRTERLLKLAREFADVSGTAVISDSESLDVLVPDTESPEYEDNIQDDQLIVTVPCSQVENRSQGSSGQSDGRFATIVRVPSDSSEQSNIPSYLPDKTAKTFVIDSEAVDSEESARIIETRDTQCVVPDSEAIELDGSPNTLRNSRSCAFVPDTEGNDSENLPKRFSDSENQFCVPDSEAVDSYSSPNMLHRSENQAMDCKRSSKIVQKNKVSSEEIIAIPSSQLDDTPENEIPEGHAASAQQENTPGLVSRLVSLVRAVSSSPVSLVRAVSASPVQMLFGGSRKIQQTSTPCVKPVSAKKLETVFEAKPKPPKVKGTLEGTPERKKFFELLQYSSDDEENVMSSSDINSICDSPQVSSNHDISNLFERLQKNLAKSATKKKPIKTSKGKKPGARKAVSRKAKKLPKNISDDSSLKNGKSNVVPESEPFTSFGSRSEDDISVIPESQSQNVLVQNTESLPTELESPSKISIPDSQETNFDLQLTVSTRSELSTFSKTQENTVRHITPIASGTTGISRLHYLSASERDKVYSSEIPLYGQPRFPASNKPTTPQGYMDDIESSTDEFSFGRAEHGASQDGQRQTAEISLQVSIMSPTEQSESNASEDDDPASQREISIQVSMISPKLDDTLNPENTEEDGAVISQREFSMQVSMEETAHDGSLNSLGENGKNQSANITDDVFFDSNTDSFALPLVSFSTQVSILDPSEKTVALETIPDGISHSGGENSDSDIDFEGADQHMSLHVSMCNQGRRSLRRPVEPDIYGSIVNLCSDEEQASPHLGNQDSGSSDVLIDDSDEDPDFEFPKIKKKISSKAKIVPQKPAAKVRKKNKSGSKSNDENLAESHPTKTVLLCEKKEVVTGLTEGMDDDYSLPDLTPPTLAPTRPEQPDDSSEDDFDAYIERLKTPAKTKKVPKRMDDFIVDDDDVSSGDDSDDGSSVFYTRTSREVESSLRTRLGGYDVFKAPSHKPAKALTKTPQPGTSRLNGKAYSKTPAPERLYQLESNSENVRSKSTGHLPRFYSFLKSLSKDIPDKHRDPEAKQFVTEFKKRKEELSSKLFKLYNDTVFDKKLPEHLNIKWNSRLLTTAGFCAYKRDKAAANARVVRIELSVKVCDTAERVRDTLIHELCHAAVWLVFGKNDGHGRYWQSFAQKAATTHLELPPISRCHVYDINHKFIYKCNKCGQQVGRHTKSLNVEKKVCGICHGRFEVHLNTPQGLAPHIPRTPRTPNKFAIFVKENYKIIKERNAGLKHADVMKALGAEFAAKAQIT